MDPVHATGSIISIRQICTWTKIELYVLVVKPQDSKNTAKIVAVIWEQHSTCHISHERTKIDIVLCRSIVGHDISTAPEYNKTQVLDQRPFYHRMTTANGTSVRKELRNPLRIARLKGMKTDDQG